MASRDQFAPPPEDDLILETEDEYQERIRRKRGGADGEEGPAGGLPPKERRRVWWLRSLVLALVALVGWETGATLLRHVIRPSDGDWKAAASRVHSERVPGKEALLFAPAWVEPLSRFFFSDQLPLEQQLLSDVDRFARIWLVSIRGARHRWLKTQKPSRSWSFGGVRVELFDKKAVEVTYSFTSRIREARVERQGATSKHLCTWQGRRFACDPRRGWNWVGPHLAEVDHRPYRCVYAHPVDGQVMRIQFPSVPLGRVIVGYTGIDDFENRKRAKAPVHLRILADRKELGTVHHLNEWPWHRFEFSTAELAGKTLPVLFEITTEGAYARTFCFSAEARK